MTRFPSIQKEIPGFVKLTGGHREKVITGKSPNIFAPPHQSIAQIPQDNSLAHFTPGPQSQTFITGGGIGQSATVLNGKVANLNTYRTEHPNHNVLSQDISLNIIKGAGEASASRVIAQPSMTPAQMI